MCLMYVRFLVRLGTDILYPSEVINLQKYNLLRLSMAATSRKRVGGKIVVDGHGHLFRQRMYLLSQHCNSFDNK